jgi:hypothetical protein
MAADVSMPQGLVRMMGKLPKLPVISNAARKVDAVLPKFMPRMSQII